MVVSSVPPHATVVGVPGHVVAFTNLSNETVERLPDPEWDRIDELARRVERLERQLGGVPANGGSSAPSTAETEAPEPTEGIGR